MRASRRGLLFMCSPMRCLGTWSLGKRGTETKKKPQLDGGEGKKQTQHSAAPAMMMEGSAADEVPRLRKPPTRGEAAISTPTPPSLPTSKLWMKRSAVRSEHLPDLFDVTLPMRSIFEGRTMDGRVIKDTEAIPPPKPSLKLQTQLRQFLEDPLLNKDLEILTLPPSPSSSLLESTPEQHQEEERMTTSQQHQQQQHILFARLLRQMIVVCERAKGFASVSAEDVAAILPYELERYMKPTFATVRDFALSDVGRAHFTISGTARTLRANRYLELKEFTLREFNRQGTFVGATLSKGKILVRAAAACAIDEGLGVHDPAVLNPTDYRSSLPKGMRGAVKRERMYAYYRQRYDPFGRSVHPVNMAVTIVTDSHRIVSANTPQLQLVTEMDQIPLVACVVDALRDRGVYCCPSNNNTAVDGTPTSSSLQSKRKMLGAVSMEEVEKHALPVLAVLEHVLLKDKSVWEIATDPHQWSLQLRRAIQT